VSQNYFILGQGLFLKHLFYEKKLFRLLQRYAYILATHRTFSLRSCENAWCCSYFYLYVLWFYVCCISYKFCVIYKQEAQ